MKILISDIYLLIDRISFDMIVKYDVHTTVAMVIYLNYFCCYYFDRTVRNIRNEKKRANGAFFSRV